MDVWAARRPGSSTPSARSSSPASHRRFSSGGRRGMRRCSGLLAELNPWVFDRMVEGQWGVAVAAAGLFLWLAAWEALQTRPGAARAALLRRVARSSWPSTPCGRPHGSPDHRCILWQRLWRDRDRLAGRLVRGDVRRAARVRRRPLLRRRALRQLRDVRQFTAPDFDFFRSVASDDYGLFVNLVGLYGYWGERIGRFPLATGGADWWPLTTAVIVGAAVLGASLRRDRAWLLLCGLFGLPLSASTALPGGVDAAVWLSPAFRSSPLTASRRSGARSGSWLSSRCCRSGRAIAGSAAGGRRRSPGRSRWRSPTRSP